MTGTMYAMAGSEKRRSIDIGAEGDEPDDHAIGRSRGGLTTKTHALVDGRGLPLVLALTPGQAGDPSTDQASGSAPGPPPGAGQPRITPQALRAD